MTNLQPNDFKHLAVQVFFEYFSNAQAHAHLEWEKKDDNFEQIVVHLNFILLHEKCTKHVRQFLDFIGEHPHDITKCLALALDSVRLLVLSEVKDQRRVIVRFYNYNQQMPLSQVKSHLINKFVAIRGTVLRVSSIKVLVESIKFTCHLCQSEIKLSFIDGKWEQPNRCSSADCHSKIFNPEKHTAKTAFYQRIRLQEIESDLKDMNAGKMPKTIDCEIKDDLIDCCISGDVATICGVMKTELQSEKGRAVNKNKALHASYIDVHSIKTSNSDLVL